MNREDLKTIAGGVKSPAYVFSRNDFWERTKKTADILGKDIDLCYSMKANPFLIQFLPEEYKHVEVCSPGELEICIARNIAPEMIIYSGLNKGEKDVFRALDYGVDLITAESLVHLELIRRWTAENRRKANVLLRIAAGSQFGVDRRQAVDILSRRKEWDGLEFIGLHFFTGTQKRKPREILREMDFIGRYMDELKESAGYVPEIIEYGTGCPAHLFCERGIDDLSQAREAEIDFLKESASAIRELSGRVKVSVEMGRFLAASCGYYITEVVDTKTNDDINYAIVDGGSHQVRFFGQMQGMQPPFISHVSCDFPDDLRVVRDDMTEGPAEWTIAGSLCTTADVLARNMVFEDLKVGDRMIFHQAGAYALYEGMSMFLSRDLPGIYLVEGKDEIKCVRDPMDTHVLNGAL